MLYMPDLAWSEEDVKIANKCKDILFQANLTYREVKKLITDKNFTIYESLEEFEREHALDIEEAVDEDRSYEEVLKDWVNDLDKAICNEHTYYIERYL